MDNEQRASRGWVLLTHVVGCTLDGGCSVLDGRSLICGDPSQTKANGPAVKSHFVPARIAAPRLQHAVEGRWTRPSEAEGDGRVQKKPEDTSTRWRADEVAKDVIHAGDAPCTVVGTQWIGAGDEGQANLRAVGIARKVVVPAEGFGLIEGAAHGGSGGWARRDYWITIDKSVWHIEVPHAPGQQ